MASPFKIKLLPVLTQLGFLMSVCNSAHDFLSNVSSDFQLLTGKTQSSVEHRFADSDLEDYKKIIKPLIIEQGSKLTLFGKDESKTVINVIVPWEEANIMHSQILEHRKINKLADKHSYTQVLLYLNTAVNKTNGENVGDKGVIESLSSNNLRLIFPDASIKEAMLGDPFTKAYIVDVEVGTIEGKPKVYKILKLHQIIDKQ